MGPEKDADLKQPDPSAGSEKPSLGSEGQETSAGGEKAAVPTTATQAAEPAKQDADKAADANGGQNAVSCSSGTAEGTGAEGHEGPRRAVNRANGRVSEGSLSGRPKRRKPRKEGESLSQSEPEGTDRESGPPSRSSGSRGYYRNRTSRDRSDTRPRVDMDESIPESHRYVWADDMFKRSLYVGNMSSQVTKEDVRALSDAIRSVRFVNRRSAFLDFESPEVASAQLELLRSMQLKGQPLQVEPSRPRSSSTYKSDRLLYVRGFPDDKGMDALGPLFPDALLIDRREGKVLLRFKDHESAINAIKEVIAHDGTDFKFSFAAGECYALSLTAAGFDLWYLNENEV
ncbi:hypothetical protein V5799_019557 [Amblyomma americanum]|uniref:RRM domain-containing protein n=2 Tax=Amblyomma americanum TaxID=6943 RepID=A0AAQ4EWI5_AMBAM